MIGNLMCTLFVSLLFLYPALCMAQTSITSPFDPALLVTYAWVVGISVLGGSAAFYRKVRDGHARAFNFAEFLGELFISAFAGLVTFWLCRWAGFNDWWAAACVGIAGHMGSRAIFMGEQIFERWHGRIFGNGGQAKP